MKLKETTFCVYCKNYEVNLVYKFQKFEDQENIESTLTSGICYDCEFLFHFEEEK